MRLRFAKAEGIPGAMMCAPGDLRPYKNNARTHSAEQIDLLARSIEEFGFNNPVLVDADGGIIAGHGRVLAAIQLGMEQVPCLLNDKLDDAQRRAYILADNRLAELAGWDEALLGLELGSLLDSYDHIELLGWTPEELSQLSGMDVDASDYPFLPEDGKGDLEQITFTLDAEQAAIVRRAMQEAKAPAAAAGYENENKNGNAIAWICQTYLGKPQ